jgi:glucose dehydrogenase
VWRHEATGSTGLLSTAGGVLFTGDGQNIVGWDAKTGKALWHSQVGTVSSPPETFMLDGKQRLLVNGSAGMYLFVMN